MSNAIRFEICGDKGLEQVIGEQFDIAGSSEIFAVHESRYHEKVERDIFWRASHVATGFSIASGKDIDSTITSARLAWQSKTLEQIEEALKFARLTRSKTFFAQFTTEELAHD